MDDYLEHTGTVDPEVRAYVTSLVNALGGASSNPDDTRYTLGDDALACLRDIKRWIRLYDEKLNRLDVTRVLAERNLVKGDLLEILASWPEDDDKMGARIALACLELLVPLTWPLDKDAELQTANHHRNVPYLQLAQIGYKREILDHPSSDILRTCVRIALPSIELPAGERTQRDEGIIRLMLYFLRNIAMIEAPASLPVEWNEEEVSRSATIDAFHRQGVLDMLLAMASNMGDDFSNQDVLVSEILYYLLKGVSVQKLFAKEKVEKIHADELKDLMSKEKSMLRQYTKHKPSRHNRFGTMIWMQRDEASGKMASVSGQDVLGSGQETLRKMDTSKKWNRPKRRQKEEKPDTQISAAVPLTKSATGKLREFVEDFLDSGFNPLLTHIRKAIEREAERILAAHNHQFFFLTGWFLEAERERRKVDQKEAESYGLVAGVLNQETFVLLNRQMQFHIDHKEWSELIAGMRGFTQILLTVQEMADSPLEEDKEIAENIQNRIFYEESTHDRILAILRGFKDQGFGYLDACTELTHTFLRMLEHYSRENIDMQVRSRRKARQKKQEEAPPENNEGEAEDAAPDSEEEEDIAEAARVSRERKFDFKRFSMKFANQHCIDTFVALASFYKDLSDVQLKRAHRFFHRVAFKQELSVMLYRVDIISLFHRMATGSECLPDSPIQREWVEFSRQLFRRLIKKVKERPELVVELLFSKIGATAFYLEHGYDKQSLVKPRVAPQMEVKGGLDAEAQIGVVVAALVAAGKTDLVEFVETQLEAAAVKRKGQEESAAEDAENPQAPLKHISLQSVNEERRMQLIKDGKMRLLMELVGFSWFGEADDPDAPWLMPSSVSSDKIFEALAAVKKHRDAPTAQWGDDETPAEELIRRKQSEEVTRRAEFDDDSDGIGELDEEALFPAGGPTVRKSDVLKELKKKRKKRADGEPLSDEALAERRKARRENERAKALQIKSALYVHDSDDATDDEADRAFFAREEALRESQAQKVLNTLEEQAAGKKRKRADGEGGRKKRARSEDEDREMSDSSDVPERRGSASDSDGESETPLSSQVDHPDAEESSKVAELAAVPVNEAEDDENEDVVPLTKRRRAALIEDSDDE